MFAQVHRMIQAALAAVVGGVSLAAIWPLIGVTAEPAMCLDVSPEQAWIGLHLHLVNASPACASGFTAGESLAPVVGITMAISVSALIVGLLALAFASGGLAVCRALLRRVGHWLRQRLVVVFEALIPAPPVAPVLVRVDGRRGRPVFPAAQRRGPPRGLIG
jgi:hypothetical protein